MDIIPILRGRVGAGQLSAIPAFRRYAPAEAGEDGTTRKDLLIGAGVTLELQRPGAVDGLRRGQAARGPRGRGEHVLSAVRRALGSRSDDRASVRVAS